VCWRKGIGILPMPAARPVDPDSPPRKGPRVERRAILARTRCATAARLRELQAFGGGWMSRPSQE